MEEPCPDFGFGFIKVPGPTKAQHILNAEVVLRTVLGAVCLYLCEIYGCHGHPMLFSQKTVISCLDAYGLLNKFFSLGKYRTHDTMVYHEYGTSLTSL